MQESSKTAPDVRKVFFFSSSTYQYVLQHDGEERLHHGRHGQRVRVGEHALLQGLSRREEIVKVKRVFFEKIREDR